MNELLARAGAFFLAPDAQPAARPVVERVAPPPPSRAAVLASEPDLLAASGMLAATLRARQRAGAAVVCLPLPAGSGAPPLPGAAALARRLTRRDLECRAAGALCRVHLPDDPEAFVVQAWRVMVAVDVPVVVAIPRRDAVHDELLAALDLLALATAADDAGGALAEVASAVLERLGPPVARIALPRGAVARHAAATGLLRSPLPQPVSA